MNTFLKIMIGFVLGIVCTVGVFYIIGTMQNTEENQLIEEIRKQTLKDMKQSLGEIETDENEQRKIQPFELTTKNGIVKLHTYMSKDSVQILMGRPQSTNIEECGYEEKFRETWKYKGSNRNIDEFTIEFIDGKLKSVSQYKDH